MHFSPEPQLRNTLCRRHGAFGKLLFWTDQKETFASRENTLLGQWEVGVGGGSRGGPMARLSRLVGRGRALEILLRKTPDLSGELFRRMNAVYAQVLPGLGARVESVIVQRERRTFHAGGSCGNVSLLARLRQNLAVGSDLPAGAAHALSKGSRRQPALRRYVHADLKLDPPKRNRASAWNGSVEIPASEVMPNSGTGHIARNNPTQSDAGWPANEAAITPQQSVPAPGIRPATSQPAAKPAAAQVQRVKHKQVDGGCHPTQEPHADADHNLLSGNSLGSRPSAYRPRPPQRPRRLEVREQRRSSGGKHVYRLADSKRLRICLLWLDSQTTTWDLPKYFHLSRFRQQRKTEMSHYIPDTPPRPENKRVWASLLKGKTAVIQEVAEEMQRRDPSASKTRVALTDGERALQIRVDGRLNVTLILDLMHALEKLWKAAYVFHAEGSLEADLWVLDRTLRILSGDVGQVVKGLRQSITKRGLSGAKRKTLEGVADYLYRNRTRMRYDEYLANGWPIASGPVEGACKHLIKDRMERSGMRWTEQMAEAIVQLRAKTRASTSPADLQHPVPVFRHALRLSALGMPPPSARDALIAQSSDSAAPRQMIPDEPR